MEALTEREVKNVFNIFLRFEQELAIAHEAGNRTRFRISVDEHGDEFGEIVFGEDIFPGGGVVDPNSVLSVNAAAAHEASHHHRWVNRSEIDEAELEHIDEALTSLEAIQRYPKQLEDHDVRMLVADAIQRLNLFAREWRTARQQE
jgi:hypothetical protein